LDIDGEEFGWADWMFDPDYKADGPLSAKDAVIAMVRDGEPLFDKGGRQFYWDNNIKVLWHTSDDANDDSKAHIVDKAVFPLPELYRRPKKHKRLMSRSEALNWANSEASRGWAVRWKYDDNNLWSLPKRITYIRTMDQYLRAQLIPDLFGVDESTIQGFEVEE
jgi:hypothetical protein